MKQKTPSGARAAIGWCAVAMAGVVAAGAQEASLVEHMHDHYDAIVKVKLAVIDGDLESIREPARWLAEHPAPADLPAHGEEYVEAMRAAARAAVAATDFTAAAEATSLMGKACGDCHMANDVTVAFASVDEPGQDLDRFSHMLRHRWAADRMWEGIIGPSEPAWSRGIDILLEAPLTAHELESEPDDGTRQMARRVHQLAANGMMAVDSAEKAEIYAEFLANCASCHAALR